MSFHLHQSDKYGFIEPAPDRARDGRDRWWRLSYEDGVDWDQLAATSAGAAAVRSRLETWLEATLEQIRSYFSPALAKLPEWEEGAFSHDWYLQLTPVEAAEFDREYLDLCKRWRGWSQDRIAAGDSSDRARFGVFIFGVPLGEG